MYICKMTLDNLLDLLLFMRNYVTK